MPDIPDITLADYHTAGRAAIERAKEDASWTMSRAGLPQERIVAVTRRIDVVSFTLLTEHDVIIERRLAFAAKPRDPEHAKLMQSLIGWHIQEISKALAVVAATEIKKALEDYQQTFVRHEPVIEATYRKPWPPDWLATILRVTNAITRGLVWFLGICVLTLLVWAQTASLLITGMTVGLSLIFWLFSGAHWLSVLFPLGAIGVVLVFLL
jgi:hypothetical protein